MKVNSLEEFEAEAKKALSVKDKDVRLEYETMTFGYSYFDEKWVIKENGLPHCDGGPAVFYIYGGVEWWYMGKLHRTDGPAVIGSDGSEDWYWMGKLHRDGAPAVIRADGTREWWYMGKRHRIDAPAVIKCDGTEEWWVMGKLHRDGAPAVIRADGTREWWVMNCKLEIERKEEWQGVSIKNKKKEN